MIKPLTNTEIQYLEDSFQYLNIENDSNPFTAISIIQEHASLMNSSAVKVDTIISANELINNNPESVMIYMLTKHQNKGLEIGVPLTGTSSMLSVFSDPYQEHPEYGMAIASIDYVTKEGSFASIAFCSQYNAEEQHGSFEAAFYTNPETEDWTHKLNVSNVKEFDDLLQDVQED